MTTREKTLIACYDPSSLMSFEEYCKNPCYEHDDEDEFSPELDYDNYLNWEHEFMLEDLMENLGRRLEAMDNLVHVTGVNLDWRRSSGERVISVSGSTPHELGSDFFYTLYPRGIDAHVYLHYVGRYDTKKGFRLVVAHHDAVSTFYVKRA
jgi:hypothetical protein